MDQPLTQSNAGADTVRLVDWIGAKGNWTCI